MLMFHSFTIAFEHQKDEEEENIFKRHNDLSKWEIREDNLATYYMQSMSFMDIAMKNNNDATAKTNKSKGKWIMHISDLFPADSTQECSICHEEQIIYGRDDNFCPNCGADMRGK